MRRTMTITVEGDDDSDAVTVTYKFDPALDAEVETIRSGFTSVASRMLEAINTSGAEQLRTEDHG